MSSWVFDKARGFRIGPVRAIGICLEKDSRPPQLLRSDSFPFENFVQCLSLRIGQPKNILFVHGPGSPVSMRTNRFDFRSGNHNNMGKRANFPACLYFDSSLCQNSQTWISERIELV